MSLDAELISLTWEKGVQAINEVEDLVATAAQDITSNNTYVFDPIILPDFEAAPGSLAYVLPVLRSSTAENSG